MSIYLLTHQKEFKRPTNTGNIVISALKDIAFQILWERKNPHKEILEAIDSDNTVLLFNSTEGEVLENLSMIENFIILDGTWQEAKKIYNKSPYLKNMKTFTLNTGTKSIYNLRRNQIVGGLCTAECVIEILKIKGDLKNAQKLNTSFLEFLDKRK